VLFGLLHSPQGVWGMAGAALAGILLGLLFLAAGSLLLPCIAHYVANMMQIGVAYRARVRSERVHNG
jgi:membrane protease YdiL (CAAX protease family)